ncbi:hypothetical protein [Agromyces sp. LHK192]|uniref:hypothetical protein n=1 Tax=Agromyces sp. LHK192 TaxID=2498704 RepID=UPI000FDCD227|nr:hypothetical protein [Agromyces sp. LHK192]
MYISEFAFPHLVADRDARMAEELEQRRVILERLEADASGAEAAARHHWWSFGSRGHGGSHVARPA